MTDTIITPEVQTMLAMLVRQELETQLAMRRENRTTYQTICKDFAPEMETYNKYTWHSTGLSGKKVTLNLESNKWGTKIKSGISALLRAMYHVDYVARLPASAEPEMRAFVRGVLDLMEQYSPKEPAADSTQREMEVSA